METSHLLSTFPRFTSGSPELSRPPILGSHRLLSFVSRMMGLLEEEGEADAGDDVGDDKQIRIDVGDTFVPTSSS